MGFIKILMVALLSSAVVAKADICNDPLRQSDLCHEMRHMRSQILGLGAQRDLMQINYPLMAKISSEIQGVTGRVLEKLKVEDPNHVGGIIGIQFLATEMATTAAENNSDTFITANKIQAQCMNCHNKENPSSGKKWNEVFKKDWSQFYNTCNEFDRNPYRCKSMYGMLSAYSSLFTASQLGREDFDLVKLNAKEISRIAQDLKVKQMFHGSEIIMARVEAEAGAVAELAEQKDATAFQRAVGITQACMQCHADRANVSNKVFSWKHL